MTSLSFSNDRNFISEFQNLQRQRQMLDEQSNEFWFFVPRNEIRWFGNLSTWKHRIKTRLQSGWWIGVTWEYGIWFLWDWWDWSRYVTYATLDSTVKASASRDKVKCNWATGKKCTLRESVLPFYTSHRYTNDNGIVPLEETILTKESKFI